MIFRLTLFMVLLWGASFCRGENFLFGNKIVRINTEELKLTDFKRAPGMLYLLAKDQKANILVSFAVRVESFVDSKACRRAWWPLTAQTSPKRENVKEYDDNDFAVIVGLFHSFRNSENYQSLFHLRWYFPECSCFLYSQSRCEKNVGHAFPR